MPIMVMMKHIPVQLILKDDVWPEDDLTLEGLTHSKLLLATTVEKSHKVAIFTDAIAFMERMSDEDYQEYRRQRMMAKFGGGLGSEKLS